MDDSQREVVADQVRNARAARGWSQARLAEEAGVAANTVSSLESGNAVRAQSLGAVMGALDIEPAETHAAANGYPADVELVRDVIGMWLMGMPDASRPAAAYSLLAHITGTAK